MMKSVFKIRYNAFRTVAKRNVEPQKQERSRREVDDPKLNSMINFIFTDSF